MTRKQKYKIGLFTPLQESHKSNESHGTAEEKESNAAFKYLEMYKIQITVNFVTPFFGLFHH